LFLEERFVGVVAVRNALLFLPPPVALGAILAEMTENVHFFLNFSAYLGEINVSTPLFSFSCSTLEPAEKAQPLL